MQQLGASFPFTLSSFLNNNTELFQSPLLYNKPKTLSQKQRGADKALSS